MIRKAKATDLKKISVIFRTEYLKPPYNEKWSEKWAMKKVREYYKDHVIFVMEMEKEVVGFIMGNFYTWDDGIRGFVNEFVISSKFQGKSYGSKLFRHFENFVRKKGSKKISLFSSTKSKAFKMYKKLGFKKEDLVSMVKTIK